MKPAATPSAPARLQRVKQTVDAELTAYCRDGLRSAQQVDDNYAHLWEGITAVVTSGGKRLRPYLATLLYEGLGGRDDAAFVRVATAWELLHSSMLVHDDVIDRDYVRHGTLNIGGRQRQAYHEYPHAQALREHLADGAAIMGGDLLLAAAYHYIATSQFGAEHINLATRIMSDAVFAVASGELLDTEATMLPIETVDTDKIANLKTAQYSIVGPMLSGALLAGASQESCAQLRRLGQTIGIAYQLQDDLLSVFGNPAKTGKPVGNDLREGKRTMLLQEAFWQASKADKTTMHRLLARANIDDIGVDRLREIIIKTKAVERLRARIAEHHDRALTLLANLPLTKACQQELGWFIDFALERDT